MHYETNSKNVKNGDVFVCIKGLHFDGHDFIDEAIKNGASLIIGSKKLKLDNIKYKKVKDPEKYLTKILGKDNKKLTKDIKIIGITGTKGKTTTASIVYNMLIKMGVNAAYIGTLGLYYKDKKEMLDNTTPDILSLNKIFKKLKEENITHVVMEISSHALFYKRINGLTLSVASFTNLSQDHIDFHKTMDNYLHEKLKILKYLDGPIILNDDDNASNSFKKKTRKYITIGKNGDYKINNYILYETNTIINIEHQYNKYSISIPYIGKFNIYNYLEALCIMIALGYDILDIINITNSLPHIKGRCELIKTSKGFIVIDYAHSPASVKEVLETYNKLKKGKIITIIGCGGNRDKIKRPIMGDIAVKNSDYVIFTSDNPRDENPKEILRDMTKDLKNENYEIIENRKEAIKKGVKLLSKKDYLLILGKGHEDYQIINNNKYHFDDKEEALKYINYF